MSELRYVEIEKHRSIFRDGLSFQKIEHIMISSVKASDNILRNVICIRDIHFAHHIHHCTLDSHAEAHLFATSHLFFTHAERISRDPDGPLWYRDGWMRITEVCFLISLSCSNLILISLTFILARRRALDGIGFDVCILSLFQNFTATSSLGFGIVSDTPNQGISLILQAQRESIQQWAIGVINNHVEPHSEDDQDDQEDGMRESMSQEEQSTQTNL